MRAKKGKGGLPAAPTRVFDVINQPAHYNHAGIECIEAIEAASGELFEGYMIGNSIKYLWRYRYKNGIEDLKKGRWYLDRLINHLETRNTPENP